MEAHPYDFVERHDDAYSIVRGTNARLDRLRILLPHLHLDDGVGDVERMITSCAPKLREVHVADTLNHRANDGNRYIINPPGVDARVHQHSEIGKGEGARLRQGLRDAARRGLRRGAVAQCVGFREQADEINRHMLEKARPVRVRRQITAPDIASRPAHPALA